MPTFEITLPVILSSLTALGSLLFATATVARRSQAWDIADKLRKIVIDGDPENDKKSLVTRTRENEEAIARVKAEAAANHAILALQVKWIKRALNAHGSDEHVIADAVRTFVASNARAEFEAAGEARRSLISDQDKRFSHEEHHRTERSDRNDRSERSRVKPEFEDDPFPTPREGRRLLTPLHHLTPPRPIPRVDPDSLAPPPEEDPRRRRR